jgi:hypothetical protein
MQALSAPGAGQARTGDENPVAATNPPDRPLKALPDGCGVALSQGTNASVGNRANG